MTTWQRDEANRALQKARLEKESLHRESCQKSERHFQSIQTLQKTALLAEHELQKKSKEVISLNNKHKMTVKAYKGLQKEVEAWPRVLTKFER
jgi:uncharacterized CHY-type Zn-finger protein